MNTEVKFDMDSILDGTLDDLADIPSIERWDAGNYKCLFNWEQKVVNGHPSIQVDLTLLEVLELPAGSNPPADKAKTSILYMLDNEIGQGKLKKLLADLALGFQLEGKKNRDILEVAKGAEVAVILTKRQRKKDGKLVDGVFDNDIQELAVA